MNLARKAGEESTRLGRCGGERRRLACSGRRVWVCPCSLFGHVQRTSAKASRSGEGRASRKTSFCMGKTRRKACRLRRGRVLPRGRRKRLAAYTIQFGSRRPSSRLLAPRQAEIAGVLRNLQRVARCCASGATASGSRGPAYCRQPGQSAPCHAWKARRLSSAPPAARAQT